VEIELYEVENDRRIYFSLTLTSRERRVRIVTVHTHHLTVEKLTVETALSEDGADERRNASEH
jgi:hypothetical protein